MSILRLQTLVILVIAVSTLGGCGASAPMRTGFLSDYSNLTKRSDTSYRYIASGNRLASYDRFIIEPVRVYYHGGSARVPGSETQKLANYLRSAIVKAISDRYPVVNQPGRGVARVRIALTDVKKSTWWMNIHPGSKLTGSGTGEAAMEGELLDSLTNEQIVALVESQRGNQFELDQFSEYDDVKDVMDDWAQRFRTRLDEAHGRR